MGEFPPHNSIVAIKSCRFGTYLTACEDEELVRLDKAEDPNRLPRNSLWTLETKFKLGSIGSVRIISCYDKFLAAKGIFKTLCQDRCSPCRYQRFERAAWSYDRIGSTGKSNQYRLNLTSRVLFIRARGNGQVELESSLLFTTTDPEVYWSIEIVKLPHYQTIHDPGIPFHCRNDPNKDEKPKQKSDDMNYFPCKVEVNCYNQPHAIISYKKIGSCEQNNGNVELIGNCYNQPHFVISGMNKNGSGNQNNGNAQVGNHTTTITSKEQDQHTMLRRHDGMPRNLVFTN